MTDASATSLPAAGRGPARHLPLLALILGGTVLGFSPIFVRLSEIGPTASAFQRVCLALPVLFLWLAIERRRQGRRGVGVGRGVGAAVPARVAPRDMIGLGLAGFFFAGDLAFWHWSVQLTSVTNATLLSNFSPVIVTATAFLVFGERVRPLFVLALALGVGGAMLLVGGNLALKPGQALGDLFAVVTALFYSFYLVGMGRLRGRLDVVTVMAWTALVTAILLLPVALIAGETLWPVTLRGWAILAGLAYINHVGGQSLIAYAFRHLPASFGAVVLLIQPPLAAVFAWAILGEAPTLLQGVGGLVILAGIYLAQRARPPAPPSAGPKQG